MAEVRQWQREPPYYKPLRSESHVCPNCGQKVTTSAKLVWQALKDDICNLFDVEAISLTRTFWHLLWRPDYLINDCLSDKRKVCMPPVNTLILLGMLYMLVKNLFGP